MAVAQVNLVIEIWYKKFILTFKGLLPELRTSFAGESIKELVKFERAIL